MGSHWRGSGRRDVAPPSLAASNPRRSRWSLAFRAAVPEPHLGTREQVFSCAVPGLSFSDPSGFFDGAAISVRQSLFLGWRHRKLSQSLRSTNRHSLSPAFWASLGLDCILYPALQVRTSLQFLYAWQIEPMVAGSVSTRSAIHRSRNILSITSTIEATSVVTGRPYTQKRMSWFRHWILRIVLHQRRSGTQER